MGCIRNDVGPTLMRWRGPLHWGCTPVTAHHASFRFQRSVGVVDLDVRDGHPNAAYMYLREARDSYEQCGAAPIRV